MILNTRLPVKAWRNPRTRRLPGVQPVAPKDWLYKSETFAAQMAYRRHLIQEKRNVVFAAQGSAYEACEELRHMIGADDTDDHPLISAGLCVQEDLCVLQKQDDTHILTAGILCFPSSWTLAEKIGHTLTKIHRPVPEFSPVADTVERMLSAIRVEQPLGRANFLIYTDPELHQPRAEGVAKPIDPKASRYVRVERQTFRRMPHTHAVIFAIHTAIVSADVLSVEDHAALAALKPELLTA